MAYFGKEFTFVKQENYEEFVNAVGIDIAAKLQHYIFNQSIQKNGDSYKLVFKTPGPWDYEIDFEPGVPFRDATYEDLFCDCTITVDGDTFTHVQNFDPPYGNLTSKREYSANELKVSVTSSLWDGVFYRYYQVVPAVSKPNKK